MKCIKCGSENPEAAKYCMECGSQLVDAKEEETIYNLIILDESGSMISMKFQAISGFNETVQTIGEAKIKHPEQRHIVSLVSFNSSGIKTLYDRVEANSVKELTDEMYHPKCNTPLYDAIGQSLTTLRQYVKPEDKALVSIITDGYENASREYNGAAIKKLIDELKSLGWVFTYIGANQDVEAVAASISITNVLKFESTTKGSTEMYKKEKKARSLFYDKIADKVSSLQDKFFDEDDKT
ncbi:MAG: VWA domain-containing protein [Tannerella sp.]|jgi:Mg-chelatase subunit ChlD|nr:VWA domain-containing protein [Tannerella sp.]